MTIPRCSDCKHFRAGGPRDFFSLCRKYDEDAPQTAWVYGVERIPMVATLARAGPWQRLKLALSVYVRP